MRSILLTTAIFMSFTVSADFDDGIISKFAGEYNEPSGTANADIFKYGSLDYVDVNFLAEKQAGSIYLEVFGETYEFSDIPKIVDDLNLLKWNDVTLESTASALSLNVESLSGDTIIDNIQKSLNIKKLTVDCHNKASDDERTYLEELLDSCLNKYGKVTLNSFKMKKDGKETALSRINLTANNNSLSLKIKIKGGSVKGTGNIYYENDRIKIKVSKVKFGIFNITKKVFKELNKMDNDKIIVNRPWIEVLLK
jgi:hypothetical protein